jgi:hypothetical protein
MKRFFLFSSLLLLFQCKNDDLARYIDLYNNSGSPISYYLPWEDSVFYPDTTLPDITSTLYKPYMFKKQWSVNFGSPGPNENQLFAMFPTDTLSIFFFDPDTLLKYDWRIIREEYKILVRYDLSHSDLKKLNWRIDYPPTEAMKDVKMYPPYKEWSNVSDVSISK